MQENVEQQENIEQQENHIRKPGEAVFSLILVAASIGLLFKAYGIAGFESLSSAGALPMGVTAVMVVCSAVIAWQTWTRTNPSDETFSRAIMPPAVWIGMILITVYAFLLVPLGFLPTSFLFLSVMIKALSNRSIFFCAWVSALSLAIIYAIFRVIFTVIMPEGFLPEGQILAWFGKLFTGGK